MSSGPVAEEMERWIIIAVILAAIIAVALVAFNAFGIAIPSFAWTIGWIIVVALVAVAAIKALMWLAKR